jgi:Ca2+-binding EF-hand superfamily protein
VSTRFAAYQELQVRALFDLYDSDADNALDLNELAVLLQEIGNKITALPAVCASHQHSQYTV